jgi:hypothetical protein
MHRWKLGLVVLGGLGALWLPQAHAQEAESNEDLLGGFEGAVSTEDLLGGFGEPEDQAGEDLLGGFDAEAPEAQRRSAGSWKPPALSGSFGLDVSWAYAHEAPTSRTSPDWRGLRKARSFFQLRWDEKHGGVRVVLEGKASRDDASAPLEADVLPETPFDWRAEYVQARRQEEQEVELREAFLEFSPLETLDLRLGRQINVWGMLDSLTLVDVLNPRDNREPGLVDLDDARLPVWATRLDGYLEQVRIQVVANHEVRFNKEPGFGNEYFYYPDPDNLTSLKNRVPLTEEEIPDHGGSSTEYGLSVKRSFSGWDVAGYYAEVFDDSPHLVGTFSGMQPLITARKHARLTLRGAGASAVVESWLLKGEVAQTRGFRFFGSEQDFVRSAGALGVEYSGISNVQLGLEASLQRLEAFNDIPYRSTGQPNASLLSEVLQSAWTWRQDLLQQTLHLNVMALQVGASGEYGGSRRVGLEYDWADGLNVEGGLLLYQPGESAYAQQLDDNDRLFAGLSYAF